MPEQHLEVCGGGAYLNDSNPGPLKNAVVLNMTPQLFRTSQPLILASASPRRRELLASMGLVFSVVPSGAQEDGGDGKCPADRVQQWAIAKAMAVAQVHPASWIVAADTIVVLDGEIFGKPCDPAAAASMLERLSGRSHEVITGLCLAHAAADFLRVEAIRSLVRFKHLTAAEIAAYLKTGEPFDKAGAYGIQGLGAFFVEAVYGSYTNVVGLPLCEIVDWLLAQQVIRVAGRDCGEP